MSAHGCCDLNSEGAIACSIVAQSRAHFVGHAIAAGDGFTWHQSVILALDP